jgi:hypothetical protein
VRSPPNRSRLCPIQLATAADVDVIVTVADATCTTAGLTANTDDETCTRARRTSPIEETTGSRNYATAPERGATGTIVNVTCTAPEPIANRLRVIARTECLGTAVANSNARAFHEPHDAR